MCCDPWGNIEYHLADGVTEEEAIIYTALCPLTYRGYNYDFTTGIYYLQSRYYNPEWGRFLNCDDTAILLATQGETHNANLFAYCANNPVNRVDYSGMLFDEISNKLEMKYNVYLLSCAIVFATFYGSIEIVVDNEYRKGGILIHLSDERIFDNNTINFSDAIYMLYKTFDNSVFYFFTKVVNSKFYDDSYVSWNIEIIKDGTVKIVDIYPDNDFATVYENKYHEKIPKRKFLFSDACVANEIQEHCFSRWNIEGKYSAPTSYIKTGSEAINTLKFIYNNIDSKDFKVWNWDWDGLSANNHASIQKSCERIDIYEKDVIPKEDLISYRDRVGFLYYYGIRDEYYETKADPFYYPNLNKRKHEIREDWKNSKIEM